MSALPRYNNFTQHLHCHLTTSSVQPQFIDQGHTLPAHPATQTTMLHSSFYSQRSLAIHLMDFAAFTLDYIIGVAHSAYLVTPASII